MFGKDSVPPNKGPHAGKMNNLKAGKCRTHRGAAEHLFYLRFRPAKNLESLQRQGHPIVPLVPDLNHKTTKICKHALNALFFQCLVMF